MRQAESLAIAAEGDQDVTSLQAWQNLVPKTADASGSEAGGMPHAGRVEHGMSMHCMVAVERQRSGAAT